MTEGRGDYQHLRCVCEHSVRDHLSTVVNTDDPRADFAVLLRRCKGGRCSCPRFTPAAPIGSGDGES